MGTAMAWPLVDNGWTVHVVGTPLDDDIVEACQRTRIHPRLKRSLPATVHIHHCSELDSVIAQADLVVSGVSSPGIDWMAETLAKRLHSGQMLVGITKGLRISDDGKVIVFPDLIASSLPRRLKTSLFPAAIGGPCIAGELAARRQTCVMVGSRDSTTAKTIAAMLGTSYYHPVPTDDLLSLEVGVALKNAYTVAVGMAYGMHTPDEAGMGMHNPAAALFAAGCQEIGFILNLLGGNERLASALPGAGDLFVTSVGGRTMTLGKLLGQGIPYEQAEQILAGVTLESVQIIREMAKAVHSWQSQGRIGPADLPLLRTLIAVIVDGKPTTFPFSDFFKGA